MAKWGSVDYRQIKRLQEKMAKFEEKELKDFCEAMARELAARLLAMVIDRTPVISGDLRRAWTAGRENVNEKGNVVGVGGKNGFASTLEVRQEGDSYAIEIINSMNYASYVEYGHRQEPGRFVPGYWEGNKFVYVKDAKEQGIKTGMVLKKAWVKGRFMLTKSEVELESKMPRILEKRLEKKLRELFDD